jgi:transposase
MFDILPQTLNWWYEKYLSDYYPDRESGKWHPAQVAVKVEGEILKEKPLYVFKPENIGRSMGIDDKGTGHEGFTILSNSETGKIALMMESVKSEEIEAALELFGDRLNRVRSISMDMSPTCLGVSELKFGNATMVVDKFHVMPYVYDAVCDVRTRIKKEISAGLSNKKRKTQEDRQIMKDMELLRRSRYALLKPKERWTEANREVINKLFTKYEDLKQAYVLSQQFRQWYDISNRFMPEHIRLYDLHKWYATASRMKDFESVVKMIRKHERFILNFFSNGATNANAERLNGKIQRFVSNNMGIKNRDFILYRIAGYFS